MSARTILFEAVCSQRERLPLLMAVVVVVGLLLVFPFAFLESGTASHVIAVVDAALVVVCLLVFGSTYVYCTRQAME